MIVLAVHVEMVEYAMMLLLVIHVNALQDLLVQTVKLTSMIVRVPHAIMENALMEKICSPVIVMQATLGICVKLKSTNVKVILASMEDDVMTLSMDINVDVYLALLVPIVKLMSMNVIATPAEIVLYVLMGLTSIPVSVNQVTQAYIARPILMSVPATLVPMEASA